MKYIIIAQISEHKQELRVSGTLDIPYSDKFQIEKKGDLIFLFFEDMKEIFFSSLVDTDEMLSMTRFENIPKLDGSEMMTVTNKFLVVKKNEKIWTLKIEEIEHFESSSKLPEPEELVIDFEKPGVSVKNVKGLYFEKVKISDERIIFVVQEKEEYSIYQIYKSEGVVRIAFEITSIKTFSDFFGSFSALFKEKKNPYKILSRLNTIGRSGSIFTTLRKNSKSVVTNALQKPEDLPYSVGNSLNFSFEMVPEKELFIKNLARQFTIYDEPAVQIFSQYRLGLSKGEKIVGGLHFKGDSKLYTHVVYNSENRKFSLFRVFVKNENLVCKVPESRDKYKDIELEVSLLTKNVEVQEKVEENMKKIKVVFKPISSVADDIEEDKKMTDQDLFQYWGLTLILGFSGFCFTGFLVIFVCMCCINKEEENGGDYSIGSERKVVDNVDGVQFKNSVYD